MQICEARFSTFKWNNMEFKLSQHDQTFCQRLPGGGVILSYFIYNHDIVHVYI